MNEGLKTKATPPLWRACACAEAKGMCAMPSVPLNDTSTDTAEALGQVEPKDAITRVLLLTF